jgi:hypothetical protein
MKLCAFIITELKNLSAASRAQQLQQQQQMQQVQQGGSTQGVSSSTGGIPR